MDRRDLLKQGIIGGVSTIIPDSLFSQEDISLGSGLVRRTLEDYRAQRPLSYEANKHGKGLATKLSDGAEIIYREMGGWYYFIDVLAEGTLGELQPGLSKMRARGKAVEDVADIEKTVIAKRIIHMSGFIYNFEHDEGVSLANEQLQLINPETRAIIYANALCLKEKGGRALIHLLSRPVSYRDGSVKYNSSFEVNVGNAPILNPYKELGKLVREDIQKTSNYISYIKGIRQQFA